MLTNKSTPTHDNKENPLKVAKALHRRASLLTGLWSLLELQYLHEGHLNPAVALQYSVEVFELEEQCSQFIEQLEAEDVPF